LSKFSILILSTGVLANCKSGDGYSGVDKGFNDPKSVPACKPSTTSFTAQVQNSGHNLIDGIVGPKGLTLLVSQEVNDESPGTMLSLLGKDGVFTNLIKVQNAAAGLVRMNDGKICVPFVERFGDNENLRMVCDDQSYEDSGLHADVPSDNKKILRSVVYADGSLSVFSEDFVAYTEFRRSPSGQWKQIPKFVSSISIPQDSVLHSNEALTCFTDTRNKASLDFNGTLYTSTDDANSCFVTGDETSAYVLTEKGFGTISWISLNPNAETFDLEPFSIDGTILDLMMISGVPTALVRSEFSTTIDLLNMRSGDRRHIFTDVPAALPANQNSVTFDSRNGSLQNVWIESAPPAYYSEGSAWTETFHLETACL
jgi:hypothetical protein